MRHRAPQKRRGVLLLVVLSLLVLFMLIGTAFLMSSNQYRNASIASAKNDRLGTPPTKLLDRAVMQVLRDTGNPNSVVRSHSLLRDLYGSEGFEAMVYSPIDTDVVTAGNFPVGNVSTQVSRYAMPTYGAPAAGNLGPTQGQLIDIYVREHAFARDDRLILGTFVETVPDARNIIKLERGPLGLPVMYDMPLTKGYFNGCLLTITSGPARGQSTRIVDYEYIGDITAPTQTASTAPAPFPVKMNTRLFRFRVMAFPSADGNPLRTRNQLPTTDARRPTNAARGFEIADLVAAETRNVAGTSITGTTGATFVVNGRPFNGTGAGFNELAKAGEPRLNAVETITNPDDPTDPTKALFPQVALVPNHAYTILSDPVPTGNDLMGVGYFRIPGDPTSWASLNPKNIPLIDRPLRWKYQTPAGPGDADESYDAPDFQNMALAMQTVTPRNRGRVVQGNNPLTPATLEVDSPAINPNQFLRLDLEDLPLPSFHRPDLANYWFHRLSAFAAGIPDGAPVPPGRIQDVHVRAVLSPYGADGIRGNGDDPTGVDLAIRDQIVTMKRKFIMRPLSEDHPNFDGSNPASRPPDLDGVSTLVRNNNIAVPFWEAVGPWDVDNDNDGVRESVWVDLGDPVAQAEDGTLYKPLYAFLVVDLDSRLNVNAHGLVDHLRTPDFSTIPNPNYDPSSAPGPANPKRISARNLANDLSAANGLYSSNFLPSGSGYGTAEISLRPLFSPNLPGNANTILDGTGRTYASLIGNPAYDDYARILVGRPRFSDQINGDPREQMSAWGRHGAVNIRGNMAANWTNNTAAATETLKVRPGIPYNGVIFPGAVDPAFADRLSLFKFFGHPVWPSDLHGDQMTPAVPKVPTAFSSPPDLQGRFAIGLDYAGQPTDESASDVFYYGNTQSLLVDTPYELDLSNPRRRDTPESSVASTIAANKVAAINDDAPFATADLERILRAHDADSGILPDRLWNVVDAFDPLKLTVNQPALVDVQALATFGSTGASQRLAAAQQLAGVNRRLVTTDSYDLPVPGSSILSRLTYGADGQPGIATSPTVSGDDNGDGTPDDPSELGWQGSDDWYAVMYRTPTPENPTPFDGAGSPTPAAGIPLVPAHPTIVDLLKYRIQYERGKKDPTLPIYTEAELNAIVNQLLSPELLAGQKLDLNRPFGDGRDSGDGIDNDGNGIVDEPGEPGDLLLNGIVDDPAEAGEPFLDTQNASGQPIPDGKYQIGEKWIDVNANGSFDGPIDRLWDGLTSEPIAFDYTQGHGEPIHSEAANPPAIPLTAKVRNLNNQGRQLYARQLYCLMMLLMDENYLEMPDIPSLLGNNLNLEIQTLQLSLSNGNPAFSVTDVDKFQMRRKLTAQRIAQWAINCVDFRDADSIMIAFEYDENPWDGWGCLDGNGENIPLDGDVSTDENLGIVIDWENLDPTDNNASSVPPYRLRKPIKQILNPSVPANRTRNVVWGAERPELLITETLAFHDRRCTDEPENGSLVTFNPNDPPEKRDYDLDQRLKPRGSLYVELYNPSSADGNKPAEFYGSVPGSGVTNQGVMLNRLSNAPDFVSGKYSPVWRMTVLREPLNGRMPVFRDPATKLLQSGVVLMNDDPSTPAIEGFGPPDANDRESVTADFLTYDPDGFGVNMDEAAERFVYFTTGDNYFSAVNESDPNRADDENPINGGTVVGDWDYSGGTPIPVVNQLQVRVPPLPQRIVKLIGTENFVISRAKRYFIARKERVEISPANDQDVTIAPILPGRYAVIGSSGLQLSGLGAGTLSTPDGQVAQRFVTAISRSSSLPEDASLFGTLPIMRRIELWPDQIGRPTVNQVLVAENGGPEFIRINNNTVINATDRNLNGNPTDTSANEMLIEPAVAIPVEDLNVSEPVDGALRLADISTKSFVAGYPSATYRELYVDNPVQNANVTVPMPELSLRLSNEGELEFWDPFAGDPAPKFYDRPLDTDFELIRNGTTQNYRSLHLQRLANPTLPWNPLPFDSAGNPHPMHRPWLPVNPYRTIDSQSTDLTAFNGATTAERIDLPKLTTTPGQDLTTDALQANILAPITAKQFLNAPDHEIWAMLVLMKLKGVNIDNSPEDLRKNGETANGLADIENSLEQLEAIEPGTRALLTAQLNEQATTPKYPNGLSQGWHWHMYRRVLPDDQIAPDESKGQFRQWLHFKSLERGYHASNYFKYPKPGAFFSANPATLEGWAPDVSVMPRTLWKQERPNARLFVQSFAPANAGIVDASDLKNATSHRVLSNIAEPGLTSDEYNTSIPDSEITRNRLVWNQLNASVTSDVPVFDYVMEQTLGFINESFAPDLERDDGQIAGATLDDATTAPRIGAPEVAKESDQQPAEPLSFGAVEPLKEIWNAQRQAAILQGTSPPNAQPSLLQAVVNASLAPLTDDLVDEFHERRRSLTKSTFPWLTWNDRPFTSANEVMQVVSSSSSLMLREYSIPSAFTPNPTLPVTTPSTPEDSVAKQHATQTAPFGHLLNLFNSSVMPAQIVMNPLLPTGGSNFGRILNYVEVSSRYVGTETLLSPEVFSDNPLDNTDNITGLDDPRLLLQPPFNKVSRQRDPGRVNLNTVTGRRRVESSGFIRHWSEVYDGIMHRYGDGNLMDPSVVAPNPPSALQLSHFGPAWRDVELSRRGYAQFNAAPVNPADPLTPIEKLVDSQNQPETFAFGLNQNFPSMFSNPFRSADAGDLVPLPNMVRSGVEATWLRGIHWQRAFEPTPTNNDVLIINPFAAQTAEYDHVAWGVADYDDDGNGIKDDVREAGYGIIANPPTVDGDTLRVRPSLNNALEGSGIPLFSEQVPEPAIDGERNPGMMYQPMTRLGNLVTTRSNVYAIWVTVGYFEVERAPDWNDSAVRARFGGTTSDTADATIRARALYDRVYPDGYTLGEELGTDTGNTNRQRAFYIIDRTEPVGFKPGEDLNTDKMIRVRRRIE